MELTEEELVKRVAPRNNGSWREGLDDDTNKYLAKLRFAIWQTQLKDEKSKWDPNEYVMLVASMTREEILGRIARVKMENDL